jgi:enoyl-CoA hydratase/carnithine racemase
MSYETVLLDVKDQVATITLNRPDRMNAWSPQLAADLSAALGACEDDDRVRAVVVTGAGKAFCAGADLGRGGDTFAGRPQGLERRETPREEVPRTREIWPHQLSKPVIAALNGHAIGVGITLPMMCDIRIAAEDAKLQFAFVRRGVIPELASHVIVQRVCGLSNAADLLLSGRVINGAEAARIGLVSQALPREQVLPAALERARDIAVNTAPASVAISKRLLWEGLTLGVDEMRKRENPVFAWLGSQPDAREGVVSFLEKRPPRWSLTPRAGRDFLAQK